MIEDTYLAKYDRDGNRVPDDFRSGDSDYKRVAQSWVGEKWISTVWLSLNHQFDEGPPLIFETMVFDSEHSFQDEFVCRYSTEEEALLGHLDTLRRLKAGESLTGEVPDV